MRSNAQLEVLEEAIGGLSKDDIIRFLLERVGDVEDSVPVSIFNAGLSPLEAMTRYLKEKNKRVGQIADILNKSPSSISLAYKNSKDKRFIFADSHVKIPLSEFSRHPSFSVLESAVAYLRSKDFRFTEIASLMSRDPRTVWTIYSRAKTKMGSSLSSRFNITGQPTSGSVILSSDKSSEEVKLK